MAGHDPFEDRLRDTLRTGAGDAQRSDVDSFLDDVHRGARTRRRRQVVGSVAAATLAIAGGGVAIGQFGVFDNDSAPTADHGTRTGVLDTAASTTTSQPVTSSPPDTTTTPGPTQASIDVTPGNTAIISITSTGNDHQWALGRTDSRGCPVGGCATLFDRSPDDGSWSLAGELPYGAGGDSQSVSQIRFAGSSTDGYDGWAYGPGLLSTHGDTAGTDWQVATSPTLGSGPRQAISDVTELEARNDTVYAIQFPLGGLPTLISSPTASDDWRPVVTGFDLTNASSLNVSEGVVAFVTRSGPDIGKVVSSPADLDTGAATGDWEETQPCGDGSGGVEQVSSAGSTLWALCSDGAVFTGFVTTAGPPSWKPVLPAKTFDPAGRIAAISTDSTVVAQLDAASSPVGPGLFLVTAGATKPTLISKEQYAKADLLGFTNASVGFVVIRGELRRTTDGGQTWTTEQVVPEG